MFKYVKTLNAASGGIETEFFPVSDKDTIAQGSVCQLSSGYLKSVITDGASKFVTLDEKVAGDGKKKLPCMRVLPGMIFETLYTGDMTMIYPGSTLNFETSTSTGITELRPETAKYAEIVNCAEYDENYSTLLITIHI